jgi:hypothetical protein
MGHTEMCLAVAGLSDVEVHNATQRLAGNWSNLPPGTQAALALARKQAGNPSAVSDADLCELEHHYGPSSAWHIAWWASRCHYMTKVADAFQFPLERENPFWSMPGARKHR